MPNAWSATWITSPTPLAGSGPMPLFRRSFLLDRAPAVKLATLRICGLGHFELRLNRNKIGDHVLEPGWTNYKKTCLVVERDVTSLLLPGENVIGVLLGNGMYNVAGGRYRKFKGSFGPPKLIAELNITLDDDSTLVIKSDESWKTTDGPVRFSCIYGGEDYDARAERVGWDGPGFDDSTWLAAQNCDGPGGELVSLPPSPSRIMRRIEAISVKHIAADIRLFDLGQNISGWPAISVHGSAGKTVTLKTGEVLDAQGRVSQENTGAPVSFSYTSRGERGETWHPRFSLTGFRYIEASGDINILESVGGHFVHNAAKVIGNFECSSAMLNRIHDLILGAIRSNIHSVLTDCPHREKLGWLEQAHLMAPSLLFNFDLAPLLHKVMRDIRDAQHANGLVPTIAPQYTEFKPPWDVFNDSPEWGAAAVLLPAFVHQYTGERGILKDNFDAMKRFVDYLAGRADANGIVAYGLGDWYDIGPGDPGFGKLTTLGVTGTAALIQCLDVMAQVAAVLDDPKSAAEYRARAAKARGAFDRAYYDQTNRRYDRGSQCAQGMALALHLCQPQNRADVLDALIADIRAHDNHITAGDIGFRYVLVALAEAGRSDVVFDLLTQKTSPSYGAQLAAGATTLTEAWDANPTKSLNHMMLGHGEEWLYRHLAGIQVSLDAGADRPQLVFAPSPVGDITFAKAHHDLAAGRVECSWTRQGDRFALEVEVPQGIRAAVRLPGEPSNERPIGPGRHRFESHL